MKQRFDFPRICFSHLDGRAEGVLSGVEICYNNPGFIRADLHGPAIEYQDPPADV